MGRDRSRRNWRPEWSIPALYAALAGAWIYGSDGLVAAVAGSMERQRALSVGKGFAFVVVTAALLHAGLRLALRRERRVARRAQDSEAMLRAITDAIPDPIFQKGLDGRWRFCNPATLQAVGRTMDQVLGRTDTEIYDDPRVAAALMETDRRVMASGLTEVVEERVLGPAGERTYLSTKAPLRDAEGQVVGMIGSARDITDRKRAEQALLAAEERFQQAQWLERVGRMAGGVAHDFNNLLTVILGATDVLREDLQAGRPASAEDLEQIAAAGGRARELTGQLLAFARRQVTAPVVLDLGVAVGASERLLRRVLGEDVRLTVALEAEPWNVICDPAQVEQVILNLAVNARDAMPRGGRLTLRVRNLVVTAAEAALEGGARAGEWVQLTVQDTGTGMSPEVLAHLFEPFFTTKPKGSGTGLGLATVYGIVTQAGGTVQVRSEVGSGTTFDVRLPRHQGQAPAPAAAQPTAARSAGGSETVLAVEDDPLVRDITARALRAGGYQVLVAAGGAEALALAASHPGPIHLLLTDVIMPEMDGLALAGALRRRLPEVRVLYVSGYSQDVVSHRGILDPGVELLAKPFSSATLLARVRSVLDAGG